MVMAKKKKNENENSQWATTKRLAALFACVTHHEAKKKKIWVIYASWWTTHYPFYPLPLHLTQHLGYDDAARWHDIDKQNIPYFFFFFFFILSLTIFIYFFFIFSLFLRETFFFFFSSPSNFFFFFYLYSSWEGFIINHYHSPTLPFPPPNIFSHATTIFLFSLKGIFSLPQRLHFLCYLLIRSSSCPSLIFSRLNSEYSLSLGPEFLNQRRKIIRSLAREVKNWTKNKLIHYY